tara:strand:- start:1799 stop:2302 length:504 start_codon:yes stop_codon:yes gene_type:complete
MSIDMKLIMESWRRTLNEEEEQRDDSQVFRNVGDVKKAIAGIIKAKKGQMAKKDLKTLGVDTLIGAIPGAGAALGVAKGLASVAKNAYKLDDTPLQNVGMQTLNVDAMLSMILDDKVENEFLNKWAESFAGMDDNTELEDISATKALQKFLQDEYFTRIYKTRRGEG